MGLLRNKIRRGRDALANIRSGFAAKKYLSRKFRVTIVCGQKRSGNHAFLNWYLSQCEGPTLHYNHIRPYQMPTEHNSRFFRPGRKRRTPPTFVFSYEDRDLDEVFSGPLSELLADHVDRLIDIRFVIVMRSPKNVIASRLRKWPEEHKDPDRQAKIKDRMVAYADLILATPTRAYDLEFTPVLFDAFITSRTYRDRLSDRLDITRGDHGLDQVTSFGHGSSFEGLSPDPSKMNLKHRWHLYRDNPVFLEFMADSRLQKMDEAYEIAVKSAQQASD